MSRLSMIVRVSLVLNRNVVDRNVVDVSTTCFRVKVSCITLVDSIKLGFY